MAQVWKTLTKHLIDSHCHLQHFTNSAELCEKLENEGVRSHVMTVTPTEFLSLRERFESESYILHLGYFPLELSLSKDDESYFALAEDYRYIGEVGLDYTEEREEERQRQRDFLSAIIELNNQKAKVISLHSRRAVDDLLSLLEKMTQGTAILHWLSGTEDQVRRALENPHIYFSINPAMIKSRQCKSWLKTLPKERVLTETDGPYVKVGGKEASPFDMRAVVESLSLIWDMSLEEALDQLTENWERAVKK